MPPPYNPTSWRSILILFSHLCLGLQSGLFPSYFPTKTVYAPFLSPIHAPCSAHLIVLDLITQIIFGEQYTALSSSLCCTKLYKIIFYVVVFWVMTPCSCLTHSTNFWENILQQNSLILTSYSSEILIHWHLSRVVPRLEILFFPMKKKKISETGRSQGHVRKGLRECLYIDGCGNCWPPVSYTINIISYEDPSRHRTWWPSISRWRRHPNGILL